MKQYILHISGFGLFSAVFYVVALFVWGRYAPEPLKPNLNYRLGGYGHTYTRLQEVKSATDVDILFLGSSHAYRGFDCRIFNQYGYNTFNLGSSAQTPEQTNILLKRYLKTLKPSVIVYEVYPETFTLDGVESALDIISNDRNDFYSLEMAFKLHHIKTFNTLIYATSRDLLNLNKDVKEPVSKKKDTYIPGGYVEKATAYNHHFQYAENSIQIKDDQLDAFEKVLSQAKENNIPVVLVMAPITKSMYSKYTNIAYFDSTMKSHSDYYDFNKIISLNDSLHFFDGDHLNQSGVELFNRTFIEKLSSDGKLPLPKKGSAQ